MKKEEQFKARFLRLQLGALIGLSFVLFAFEYQSTELAYSKYDEEAYKRLDMVYDYNDVLLDQDQEEPEPVVMAVAPPAPVLFFENVETVKEDDIFDGEMDQIDPDPFEEVGDGEAGGGTVDVDPVYNSYELDNPAEFPGGQAGLISYINDNVRRTPMMKRMGMHGPVRISFVVTKEGKIADVKLLTKLESGVDKQCIEAVKNMPEWKPAVLMGLPVNMRYILPIQF